MKRKRASHFDDCVRWWARLNGRIIRFLQVTRYDEFGNMRDYYYRLQNKDPRPKGVHMKGLSESSLIFFASLQTGIWTEVIIGDAV